MTRVWLETEVVAAIHDAQLAEHGGAPGTRDAALLESALARPRTVEAYGTPDVFAVAAAHGFGIARNHPFVDGNKRTAFVAVELFLELNGELLTADDQACVLTMLTVAAGDIDEPAFAAWIREQSRALTRPRQAFE
ncbi:MAG TPA: type II toxin-antitoxin system death-on-curing family toxin [Casimicrobiaceae bacterium]|nr:type II toxin-antitoxin system death-on-curing family toxin [Casimicrobiaceae bacterium]